MRRYETIIILDPDLSESQRSAVMERTKEVIPQQGGFLAFVDEWGARRLAYEIKKKERGYYVRFDLCGTGAVIDEMERFYRIDDRVLKYMTVLTDEAPDLEKIKTEMARVESEKAEAQAAQAAQAEAQAEAETQAAAEAPVEDATPAEAEASAEDKAPVEDATPAKTEASTEDEAPAEAEAPAAAEESNVSQKSAAPETEPVVDEAAPADSKEEKK